MSPSPVDFVDRPNSPRVTSNVVAFRSSGMMAANGPSLRHAGMADPSNSTVVEADIIPFQPRRSGFRQAPGQRARIDFAARENEDHRRTFNELAAAAWVGTLMTAAYYVFNKLFAVS
jgi:hypothetical protein